MRLPGGIRVRLALGLLVVVLAAGCGGGKASKSKGFGAATQPPPAPTSVSTSRSTPTHTKFTYPRTLARRVMASCIKGGGSTEVCGCTLKRLENTVAPADLSRAGLTSKLNDALRRCKTGGSG
jgi:hypothetical protein